MKRGCQAGAGPRVRARQTPDIFAREGFETHGIEPTTSDHAHCRDWLNSEGLRAGIRIGDVSRLPYGDGSFDFVL